jgi:hypothetical protein
MASFLSLSKWGAFSIFFWLALSGCSAEWHLRKAIAKNPSILHPKEIVLIDTMVITPSLRVDTLAYFRTDTITIEKDRLRVQIKRVHDTLRISAECQADTVRIVKEIALPPVIKYAPRKWWERVPLPLLLLLVVGYFGKRLLDRWANLL